MAGRMTKTIVLPAINARMFTSPVNVSSPDDNRCPVNPTPQVSQESRNDHCNEMIGKIDNIHRTMSQKSYTEPGIKFTEEKSGKFGENGGRLTGKRFILHVQGHKDWRENCHYICVREQAPTCNSHQQLHDADDLPPEWENAITITKCSSPVFDIEIKSRDKDTVTTGINLTVSIEENREFDTDFIIIQQDEKNPCWNDITSKCLVNKSIDYENSVEITIPIEKSSKVWVVRIKKRLRSLADAVLAAFYGRVLFRILLFCKVHCDNINLRIIGIPVTAVYDDLHQSSSEVCIAKERGFHLVEISDAKQLLKKGKLLVSFYLSENCQKSEYFDLSGDQILKGGGQRGDFQLSRSDLELNPKVKVQATNDDCDEILSWRYDVKSLVNEQLENTSDAAQPAYGSLDEEVKGKDVLWLAHEVNKDWENLGTILGVKTADIQILKANYSSVVDKCSSMLQLWLRTCRQSGKKPTWKSLQEAFQNSLVGRWDIFRHLQLEDEISDCTLLKLAHEVCYMWQTFGCCLNVSGTDIEIINATNADHSEKCMDMLRKWRQGENPSKENLIKALRDPVIKKLDVANDLEKSG